MTKNLNTNYRAALAKGTTLTKIEGKDVLFSVKTGESFGLNEMAALMLSTLFASDAKTAIAKIVEDYAAPEADIANDLNELVQSLIDQKLVTVLLA
jgi:Coenzyme PQQ synthesis protein D (PqqD)